MTRWLGGLLLAALGNGACYSSGATDAERGVGAAAGASGSSAGGSSARGGSTSGGTTSLAGASGSSSGGSGATAGASAYECSGEQSVFTVLDKTCSTPDDCVLVNHVADCCGTILIMGINGSALPLFNEAEPYCSAQLPACGCAAQGTNLEDGTIIDFADASYAVECSAGECGSVYTGESFECLDVSCTGSQYCQIASGGPAGSDATGSCFPRGNCADCDCLNAVGCECSDADGHLTVTCAAP
jgi:hypothetical protein